MAAPQMRLMRIVDHEGLRRAGHVELRVDAALQQRGGKRAAEETITWLPNARQMPKATTKPTSARMSRQRRLLQVIADGHAVLFGIVDAPALAGAGRGAGGCGGHRRLFYGLSARKPKPLVQPLGSCPHHVVGAVQAAQPRRLVLPSASRQNSADPTAAPRRAGLRNDTSRSADTGAAENTWRPRVQPAGRVAVSASDGGCATRPVGHGRGRPCYVVRRRDFGPPAAENLTPPAGFAEPGARPQECKRARRQLMRPCSYTRASSHWRLRNSNDLGISTMGSPRTLHSRLTYP
jgi:hypothetical protein